MTFIVKKEKEQDSESDDLSTDSSSNSEEEYLSLLYSNVILLKSK